MRTADRWRLWLSHLARLRRSPTLRGRIVARYLAVLAALLFVTAAFQYAALRSFLIRAAADRLRTEAHRAIGSYRRDGDAEALARAVTDPFTAAWVLDTSGRTLARSAPPHVSTAFDLSPAAAGPAIQVTGGVLLVRVPLAPPPPPSGFRRDAPQGAFAGAGGLPPARLPPAQLPPGGNPRFRPPPESPSFAGPGGTLVMATLLDNVAIVLGAEVRLLALGGIGALVAAGVAGAWSLGRGLRPLEEIAGTADAVAAGDISQRAGVAGVPEEVARVGRAFNGMLDRLGAALAEEQQARERMRRFLADASHELRTPVTAIVGFLEVLRAGAARDTATLERSLATAHTQAQRMATLVDRLLSLARFDRATPLRRATVDLAAWLDALWPEIESAAAGHPLTPHARPPADPAAEPLLASVDADALGRAMFNLVENAAKYSPPGTPIEVDIEPTPDGARLTVADAGPGIPQDELPHVFERFTRGRAAIDGRVAGTGLGLAIVWAVAAAHGGTVEVRCPPGGGTRATIALPRSAAAAPQSGTPPRAAAAPPAEAPPPVQGGRRGDDRPGSDRP